MDRGHGTQDRRGLIAVLARRVGTNYPSCVPAERLQKILARAGIASRRNAEALIVAGRVKVAGRVVSELGARADPERDRIEVDGRRITSERFVYLVLHKPREVVCTMRDPEGRPTVASLVRGAGARVVPVGRLDYHTSGVLLMTNDGDFAAALAHPRRRTPKVYVAKVRGSVEDDDLVKWSESISIDGRPTQPADVKRLRFAEGNTWLEIRLTEGKNRQVRRIGEAAGFPVMRLARVEFAGITAEGLRPGSWRFLTADELATMKKGYGVPRRVVAPPSGASRGRQRAGGSSEVSRRRSRSPDAPRAGRKPSRGRSR